MQISRILAMLVASGLLTAGCGGSNRSGATTNPSGKTTTAPPESLVVQPSEIPAGFKVSGGGAPSASQSLDATGSQRTFGTAATISAKTMRNWASATYDGPSRSQLVLDAYVFATPGDAQAVWSGFTGASGGTVMATPSGAPGEQQALHETSVPSASLLGITYLFREGNVLSEVEFDGKPKQFPVSEVIKLANEQDAHIRSTLK